MKRYFLFGFDNLYPSGGMNDFKGDFDSIEEGIRFVREQELKSDNYEILDTEENIRYDYEEKENTLW